MKGSEKGILSGLEREGIPKYVQKYPMRGVRRMKKELELTPSRATIHRFIQKEFEREYQIRKNLKVDLPVGIIYQLFIKVLSKKEIKGEDFVSFLQKLPQSKEVEKSIKLMKKMESKYTKMFSKKYSQVIGEVIIFNFIKEKRKGGKKVYHIFKEAKISGISGIYKSKFTFRKIYYKWKKMDNICSEHGTALNKLTFDECLNLLKFIKKNDSEAISNLFESIKKRI